MAITKKKVVTSALFDFVDLPLIHEYGTETFGIRLADAFIAEIYSSLDTLSKEYLIHPECRHLVTKSKKYRNIILGSYLIIYRITEMRIEVLRAFHGSRSPKTIAKTKKITIDYT
ncbi:plasmid stabilization protein ParE [Flavobacterium crocinum]|uniref:Plasmid stabilization protein ParE n=1 Tax=Flavobacterium crocinum TaxID=2183896 RepID=A0A2S1YGQ8_9FLAO|nr:type II toxin-antitoxin system RelE/ParE family toxin [Flavobacterium crocinum]AWK03233.1 plasmid stabilization protein ParE [Flavobacterium crocinum]